jgi:hypothetical protein
MRLRLLTALATLAAVLALPALAQASGSAVIKDCTYDGVLNGTYTAKDYADALSNIAADVDEYSDCRDEIRRAQLSAGRKTKRSSGGGGATTGTGGGPTTGGGTTGGGGGAPSGSGDTGTSSGGAVDPLSKATPQQLASFKKAIDAGAAPVKLDGRPVDPSALGGAEHQGLSDLPTALLIMLALLAVGGFGAAALGTRRLVHGRRTA